MAPPTSPPNPALNKDAPVAAVSANTQPYSTNALAALAYIEENKLEKKLHTQGGSETLPPECSVRDLNFSVMCDGDKHITTGCLLTHLPEILEGFSEEFGKATATYKFLDKEIKAELLAVPAYEADVDKARKKVEVAQGELFAAQARLRRAKYGGDLSLARLKSEQMVSKLRARWNLLIYLKYELHLAGIEL